VGTATIPRVPARRSPLRLEQPRHQRSHQESRIAEHVVEVLTSANIASWPIGVLALGAYSMFHISQPVWREHAQDWPIITSEIKNPSAGPCPQRPTPKRLVARPGIERREYPAAPSRRIGDDQVHATEKRFIRARTTTSAASSRLQTVLAAFAGLVRRARRREESTATNVAWTPSWRSSKAGRAQWRPSRIESTMSV